MRGEVEGEKEKMSKFEVVQQLNCASDQAGGNNDFLFLRCICEGDSVLWDFGANICSWQL